MSSVTKNRITELDALRGIAAIAVVIFHYTTLYRSKFNHIYPEIFDFDYGFYGVQMFFIISGFVIFMSLNKVKNIKDFAYKRFIRLYPTYWICLTLTLIIVFLLNVPQLQSTPLENIYNYSMVQGLFNIKNIDGSYWSLLPELIFYVFIALVFKFKLHLKILWVGFIWISLIALSILKPSFLDILLNLRFGMYFLAGIMFYRVRFEKSNQKEHVLIFLCLLSVFVVRQNIEYFVVSAFIFSIFYLFVYGKLSFLNIKPLLFLGYISYPLYLLHQSIGFSIIYNLKEIGCNEYIAILIALFISILLAFIVVKHIEEPILNKIKKYNNNYKILVKS